MNSQPKTVASAFVRPLARPGSGLDMDEATLDAAVAAQGAPHRIFPGDQPPPGNDDADGARETARPARRTREPVEGKPTPRAKWGRVTVELPDYLIDELKERSFKQRASTRHMVMKALRAANYRILDADMIEDARKSNGRKPEKM